MSDEPIESNGRIAARSRRQAMDWSLALISQGIEAVIDSDTEHGWGLLVAPRDLERSLEVLRLYREENRRWPWRQKISREGILFDWGSLAWVLLIGVFFWIEEKSGAFRSDGIMDAAAVSRGQWWRLFTSVFLHADLAHLAANAGIGLLLLGLTMGCYGTGVGLLAAFLAGAGGNVATWLVYSEGHKSLGASGMVMGCVGLLAAQSISISRKNPQASKYVAGGLIGGVLLFVFLGVSPGTDVLAHLGGFVTGAILGCVLALMPRFTRNTAANILAGAAFCSLAILSWYLALGRQ